MNFKREVSLSEKAGDSKQALEDMWESYRKSKVFR